MYRAASARRRETSPRRARTNRAPRWAESAQKIMGKIYKKDRAHKNDNNRRIRGKLLTHLIEFEIDLGELQIGQHHLLCHADAQNNRNRLLNARIARSKTQNDDASTIEQE